MAESVPPFPAQKPGCLFCFPGDGGPTPHFAEWQGWGQRGRIGNLAEVELFRTDNLHIIPDISPVRPDGQHVLAVRNLHRTAFAQPEDIADDMHHVLHQLREETGHEVIFAEHGGALPHLGHETMNKNMSVEHGHVHLVYGAVEQNPVDYMLEATRQEGWNPQRINVPNRDPVTVLRRLYTGRPYLFFNYGTDAFWIEDTDEIMQSMLTQRNLSRMFGRETNWKKLGEDPEAAQEATRRLMNLMAQCNGTGMFSVH